MPGVGVAAAQSFVGPLSLRQLIRAELIAGTTPQQILALLQAADPGHQSRQYGIAAVSGGTVAFTGSGAGAYAGDLTGQVGTLVYTVQGNVLTGQPMLTSVRCDSLVDGVWFDEWTIGKLLKSKQEHRDDPVKVPSVLQQNLCQMAARHICQLYIPRLRRLGAQRLAAMLDSAVLVRPVQGAGLIIKGHAVLLTGALVEPAGSSHMPSKPARAVPSSEFMASNVGASADTIASVVSTRSVDGSADRPPSTRFVNKQVAVSFLPMSDEYRYFCQSTRLLVVRPLPFARARVSLYCTPC